MIHSSIHVFRSSPPPLRSTRRLPLWLIALGLACFPTGRVGAAIIPVQEMVDDRVAVIHAEAPDIGYVDHLFNGFWLDLYRTSGDTAEITVEFLEEPQNVGAARGRFSNASNGHVWSLEAANTMADLDGQVGSYVPIFLGEQVSGPSPFDDAWHEWNKNPVERRLFRFTVRRLDQYDHVHIRELELQTYEPIIQVWIDGQYRTVNELEVLPGKDQIFKGISLPYQAELSLSFGPDRWNVPELVQWDSEDPLVAWVDENGVAHPGQPGTTRILGTLKILEDEVELSVRALRPVELGVPFIHRTPECRRFNIEFHDGDQYILHEEDPLEDRKWPDPCEEITYEAHVYNNGDLPAHDVDYHWYFDGALEAVGSIPYLGPRAKTTVSWSAPWPADQVQTIELPAGAMELEEQQLERSLREHQVRCTVDPADRFEESCERNNTATDWLGALGFKFFIDQTTRKYFSWYPNFVESYSFEDWVRLQLLACERRLRASGSPQRLRLDMVEVHQDGELDWSYSHAPYGYEPYGEDGLWGFQIYEWPDRKVARFAKTVENPLMHEWGHQIGLIDIYAYDLSPAKVQITDPSGQPVAGSWRMPVITGDLVFPGNGKLFITQEEALLDATGIGMMKWTASPFIGRGTTAGLNRNLGLRRGFYGDYLGAIQQGEEAIGLRINHAGDCPVYPCGIRVFQPVDGIVPDSPKFKGSTDRDGSWRFPGTTLPDWVGGGSLPVNNPWSRQENGIDFHCPHHVGLNAVLIVELSFLGSQGLMTEYHFIEVDDCNVAMGEGQLEEYTYKLVTYDSRRKNRLPGIHLDPPPDEPGDTYLLTEGEKLKIRISALDLEGDPVTVTTTPLSNSRYDPDTSTFRFHPDSLQTNVSAAGYVEQMFVIIRADDGSFASTRRINFQVHDVPGRVEIREIQPVFPLPCIHSGDVDDDGHLTEADALMALDIALGVYIPTFEEECAADCDGNGVVSAGDVQAIFLGECVDCIW